jgi:hypothetical protein
MVTGRSLAKDGEGGRLTVVDGTHTMQVFHDVDFIEGGEDFTAEDLHEQGISFTSELVLTRIRESERIGHSVISTPEIYKVRGYRARPSIPKRRRTTTSIGSSGRGKRGK